MPLYITEFERTGNSAYTSNIPAPMEPPLAEQKMTITAESTQSSTLNNSTRLLAIHTSENCHIAIDTNPTASASTRRLAADNTWFTCVPAESNFKIAVISDA